MSHQYNTLDLDHVGVKASQFSFHRLKGADPKLGIEMASTGEVGCIGENFSDALLLSLRSVGTGISGKNILISLGSLEDKVEFVDVGKTLVQLGYTLYATPGTHRFLHEASLQTILVQKIDEGDSDDILTMIDQKMFDTIINTPSDNLRKEEKSGYLMRTRAISRKIPVITNMKLAKALIRAMATREKTT